MTDLEKARKIVPWYDPRVCDPKCGGRCKKCPADEFAEQIAAALKAERERERELCIIQLKMSGHLNGASLLRARGEP